MAEKKIDLTEAKKRAKRVEQWATAEGNNRNRTRQESAAIPELEPGDLLILARDCLALIRLVDKTKQRKPKRPERWADDSIRKSAAK